MLDLSPQSTLMSPFLLTEKLLLLEGARFYKASETIPQKPCFTLVKPTVEEKAFMGFRLNL